MAYTNEGLVKYCKDILTSTKTAYMWGGLMKPITLDYINYKRRNIRISILKPEFRTSNV